MFIFFPWDSMLVHTMEHKLALGEGVVEEETLVGVEEYSTAVDRSSYSSEYIRADRVGEVVLEDRGSRVIPLVL